MKPLKQGSYHFNCTAFMCRSRGNRLFSIKEVFGAEKAVGWSFRVSFGYRLSVSIDGAIGDPFVNCI
jgi:hypothetical protein